jgi:hypothetical protein
MALKLMFKGLWQNVWFANKIRSKQLRPRVTQPAPQRAVAPPGPSLSTARRVDALPTPTREPYYPQSSRKSPLSCREIGPRDIARLTVLSPCNQPPKPRWSKVNLGESLLATPSLYLSNPRVPKRRFHLNAPPVLHYASGSHAATLAFGTSRIADPRYQSPCRWKPRMPKLRCFRICATCPSSDRRLRSNRGIALRDFDVQAILALANPDSPMCDGNGSSVHLRLKPLAAPSPDPMIHGSSRLSRSNSSRRFSSLRESFVRYLRSVPLKQRRYPSRAFYQLKLFRVFSTTLPCARSSITSKSVEIF